MSEITARENRHPTTRRQTVSADATPLRLGHVGKKINKSMNESLITAGDAFGRR